jgi:hypothetical protein
MKVVSNKNDDDFVKDVTENSFMQDDQDDKAVSTVTISQNNLA